MPVSENNSAGRLYNVLQKAIAIGGKNNGASPLVTVWQQALGCKSESETITAYLGVMKLPDAMVEDCTKANLPKSSLWFLPRLKAGIVRYNFSESWSSIARNFAGDSMQGLRSCADILEERTSEQVIPQDVVEDLLAKAAELFNEVQAAGLDPDLKHFLLKQIHLIEVALRQHQINGIVPVEEALNQITGSAALKRSMWEKAAKSPITRKFTTFVSQVLIAVSSSAITTTIEQSPEPTQQTIIVFQEAAEFWQGYERTIALEEGSDLGEIEKRKALPSTVASDAHKQKSASEDKSSPN